MFGLSSYYSFLYLFLYLVSSLLVCSISSFYFFWLFIEFMMLSLIGLMFTLISSGFIELIVVFIVQTLSSLSIFVFYTLGFFDFLVYFILINLAMFPFISWFTFSSIKLPNLMLLLSSTIHKLPPFLMVAQYVPLLRLDVFFFSIVLTCLLSASFMCISSDLRTLLIYSSIANTSWIALSVFLSFDLFLSYFLVYSICSFLLLSEFNSLSNLSFPVHLFTTLLLLVLSGFPPSPLFFMNASLVYASLLWSSFFSFYLLALTFSAVLLVLSYFRFIFLSSLNSYSNPTLL